MRESVFGVSVSPYLVAGASLSFFGVLMPTVRLFPIGILISLEKSGSSSKSAGMIWTGLLGAGEGDLCGLAFGLCTLVTEGIFGPFNSFYDKRKWFNDGSTSGLTLKSGSRELGT